MTTSDLDQLVSMGFDKERAEIAVKKTGGIADAIDWLDANSSKSLDDIKSEQIEEASAAAAAAADAARSLVCNDCGKRFRGTGEAEFHATKSGHDDFSESTEEIKPLTEEERNEKLTALREKLAAKRAQQSEQDKIDQKRNEQINRKKTKETEDIKEQLLVKEQLKEADKKKREKLAEVEAKKRIQAKIAADKEERLIRQERERAARGILTASATETQTPVVKPTQPSKPAAEYTETRLRFQTERGNIIKNFPVDTTLFEVAAAVGDESGLEVESFSQNFPRKVFGREFFGESLKDLKLVPSASLIVK